MIGIYIAVPFCAQKCSFCNFASGVSPAAIEQQYLEALEAEITTAEWPAPADTLYVGGGTPSLLLVEALEPVILSLPRGGWTESTLEAAPGTVTAANAAAWRALGFDRVSLGVQSFVERELRAVGRKHSVGQVEEEVGLLRRAGFERINLDLIAGLPHQTPASWRESLDWIERLAPPHVSIYMLEADEHSRLGREIEAGGGRYAAGAVPGEEQVVESYQEAVERLGRLGLRRYEISNFALPGAESAHNLKYWRREPYRGFGADAHSFDASRRWWNVRAPEEYVERFRTGRSPVERVETVDRRQATEERFFLGLRQTAGIEPAEGEWLVFAAPIRRLSEGGLLERRDGRLRLTDRGVLLSNEVFQEFLSHA